MYQNNFNQANKENFYEEMVKGKNCFIWEFHENSEYTPQFINPDEKQKITGTALYDFVPQRVSWMIVNKENGIRVQERRYNRDRDNKG